MIQTKKFRWDKKYLYWGITAFCVVVACILFYVLLTRLPSVKTALGKLMTILSPFVWGLVIAYLLCPVVNIFQRSMFMPLAKSVFKKSEAVEARSFKLARTLSVLFAVIVLLVVIVTVIWLIAPRLYQSLEMIVTNSSNYIKTAYEWIDRLLVNFPELETELTKTFGSVSEGVFGWISNSILPGINGLITNVTSGVFYLVKGVFNILIGIIVSVYVLYNKESFAAYAKKFVYCVFSVEASERLIKSLHFIDSVFIGFLSGKILDSAIIGILCYIVCLILKMPYNLLVSVIVGITNIIPFFGPFIGAIPSALIIFMESPLQGLIFVIFIIILQQVDGNLIGPKILGSSVGINGFWIMFSIILGAGLFGFIGMLLGVPVFVVIYTGIKALVDKKLRRSGLPVEDDYYRDISYIDPETGEGVKNEEKRRSTSKRRSKDTRENKTGYDNRWVEFLHMGKRKKTEGQSQKTENEAQAAQAGQESDSKTGEEELSGERKS